MLIDAHIHLTDDELYNIKDYLILMLHKLNILAISVSMDLTTSKRNLELHDDSIVPFIGIHPWSSNNEDLDTFLDFAIKNISKVYGIGEIGLDKKYAKNEQEYSKQKHVFNTMLELAEKYGKPVSIHSRGSLDDVFKILSSYKLTVLLHWFSGSKKDLKLANDRGYYVSFGPALLYAKDKPELLINSNKDLILIETDGPVRYPKCFQNKMALPSYLISVAYAISNIINLSYEEVCELLYKNSMKYLNQRIK